MTHQPAAALVHRRNGALQLFQGNVETFVCPRGSELRCRHGPTPIPPTDITQARIILQRFALGTTGSCCWRDCKKRSGSEREHSHLMSNWPNAGQVT
jgi:hypothetical protein